MLAYFVDAVCAADDNDRVRRGFYFEEEKDVPATRSAITRHRSFVLVTTTLLFLTHHLHLSFFFFFFLSEGSHSLAVARDIPLSTRDFPPSLFYYERSGTSITTGHDFPKIYSGDYGARERYTRLQLNAYTVFVFARARSCVCRSSVFFHADGRAPFIRRFVLLTRRPVRESGLCGVKERIIVFPKTLKRNSASGVENPFLETSVVYKYVAHRVRGTGVHYTS